MRILTIVFVFIYSVIAMVSHLFAYSILNNPTKYNFLFSGYFYLYMISMIIPISFFGSFAFFLLYKKFKFLNTYIYTFIIVLSQIIYFIPKISNNDNLVNFITIGLIISIFYGFLLNRFMKYKLINTK